MNIYDTRLEFKIEKSQVLSKMTPEGLIYLEARIQRSAKKLKELLPELLAFGVGLKIGEEELTHGELIQLQRNGRTRANQEERKKWGPPGINCKKEGDGQPSSGKVAQGEITYQEVPPEIVPKQTKVAIGNWLQNNQIPCKSLGLINNSATGQNCLALITGRKINNWNPSVALRTLTWFTPPHYYWCALASIGNLEAQKEEDYQES